MTSFNTAIVSPAAAIVSSIASAVSNAQAIDVALAAGSGGALTGAGAFLAGVTLNGLATNTTSGLKTNITDLRVLTTQLQNTLSVAAQQAATLSAMSSSINTLD